MLFLCVGHGDAKKFLAANPINDTIKIIDLSQDFRLHANASFSTKDFVYGLPELNRDKIKSAKNIANPGCFATCIQLGLLPLAAKGLIQNEVHINATTGSTGAGQGLSTTSHFSWRNNNLSVYKAFEHQHLNEISESLLQLQPSLSEALNFIPQRGAFTQRYFSCHVPGK
ncbi:N-acetyl-gamma-glutamylphosphate reductase [Pedobacter sp. W3I1]|nr:N-acetyl-gamma-glutamylphosphate reductase [Pedobacter sp. W3I1]